MKNLMILITTGFLSVIAVNGHANTFFESDIHFDKTMTPTQVAIQPQPMNALDPYENFNRTIYHFNMGFHDLIGEPVTTAYSEYVPSPAQTAFKNFFSNLTVPLDAINSLLQGKVEQSLESFMRFTLNSTLGLGGLLDIATPAGLPKKEEDFGQTLSVWGVWNEASFVMVPFLGPRTTRNIVGSIADSSVNPIYENSNLDDQRNFNVVGSGFVSYVGAAPLINELRSQPDPYIFMRESYLQYRTNMIFDGQAPQANLDDFNFE